MTRIGFQAVAVLLCASCGGFGGGGRNAAERDVTGNYTLTYDNQLKVTLNVGGAVREVTQSGYGGIVDFGMVNGQPTTLDLEQFCAKPEVQCPSEAFWPKVAVDQPDLQTSTLDLQKLIVVNNTTREFDAGVRAQSLGGLVNHDDQDKFLLGLGASGGSNSNCVALGLSLAGGRFTRAGERLVTRTEYRTSAGRACSLDGGVSDAGAGDAGTTDAGTGDAGLLPDGGVDCGPVMVSRYEAPAGARVNGIGDGKVFLGWAGGCAFGPVLAGATLTFETGFTGVRTGDFDPPPYTPAPVVLPDGGLDAGSPDAGATDGGP
jgi:hypothetical protein